MDTHDIVSKSKFKPAALEYFRRVEQTGQELIISDRGKPVLKIVPYREDDARALAAKGRQRLKGSLLNYEDPYEPVGLEDWDALK
jgi:prevent-host-death family protein